MSDKNTTSLLSKNVSSKAIQGKIIKERKGPITSIQKITVILIIVILIFGDTTYGHILFFTTETFGEHSFQVEYRQINEK